jgi:uncharacterized repeat protein (TIGR02543 family)
MSCGDIVIEGGAVNAAGYGGAAGIGGGSGGLCGDITIAGGAVTATGGEGAAGIGGGVDGRCGDITIAGGTVTATGGDGAAGIGCGSSSSCGDIAIASGVTRLEATAGDGADAIGEGWFGVCSVGTVAIGGTETGALPQRHVVYPVESGTYTIRFDKNNDAATGTMDDLEVLSNTPRQLPACGFTTDGTHVFRSWNTAADGSGVKFAEGETILNYGDATFFAQWKATTFAIAYPGATDGEKGVENPNPASYTFDSGDITLADPVRVGYVFDGWTCEGQDTPTKPVVIPHGSSGDKTFTAHWSFDPVAVITTTTRGVFLGDGHTLTGTGGQNTRVIIADGATVTLDGVDIQGVNDNKCHWAGLTCAGDATIILKDGSENTVKGFHFCLPGIFVPQDKTLTITSGTTDPGTLTASPFEDGGTISGLGAGIGGALSKNCGAIEIQGGIINAIGGDCAAGIGGSDRNYWGNITISGGEVTAKGGDWAAGIGSGFNCHSNHLGNIIITGGTVYAYGGVYAAGIGSGIGDFSNNSYSKCGDITISGGTVEATGGKIAAGIGTGYQYSKCGKISITTGVTKVTAIKGSYADNSIGLGSNEDNVYNSCGKVNVGCTLDTDGNPLGGTVYPDGIGDSPFTYQPSH